MNKNSFWLAINLFLNHQKFHQKWIGSGWEIFYGENVEALIELSNQISKSLNLTAQERNFVPLIMTTLKFFILQKHFFLLLFPLSCIIAILFTSIYLFHCVSTEQNFSISICKCQVSLPMEQKYWMCLRLIKWITFFLLLEASYNLKA